jgi:prepilin-type N-terminal cleavage/methylation domain-containing protein
MIRHNIQIRANSGFTLVEMLVAVLLLSLIAVIGYSGVIFSLQQWRNGEARITQSLEQGRGIAQVRKMLSEMERTSEFGGRSTSITFEGNHDNIRFVSRLEGIRNSGLYVCKLYIDPQQKKLLLSHGVYHPENGSFAKPKRMRLTEVMSNTGHIRFEYFGSLHGEQHRWYQNWNSSTSLPRFIRISFVGQDNNRYESMIGVETSDV